MLQKFIRTLKTQNRAKNTLRSIEYILNHAQEITGKKLENATEDDLLKCV